MSVWNICSCCGAFWRWNRKCEVGPRCVAFGSAEMPAEATPGYVATVERERRKIARAA